MSLLYLNLSSIEIFLRVAPMKYLIFYFASLSSVINEVRFVERINLNLLREIIQVFSSSLLIVTQEHKTSMCEFVSTKY